MADKPKKISLWEIKIEGVAYSRLLNFRGVEAAGEHGRLFLELLLEKELSQDEILALGQKTIKVKTPEGAIIFCGVPCHVLQKERGGEIFLELQVASLSVLLDREARSRTFQGANKTWKKVLDKVKETASDAEIKAANESETIKTMLYQDKQTDWAFLRRLAESYGRQIFADTKSEGAKVSLGVLPFKTKNAPLVLWEEGRHVNILEANRVLKNTDSKARTAYFTETTVVTGDLQVGVGYGFSYDGKEQVAVQSQIVTEGSNLLNYLTLCPKEGAKPAAFAELSLARKPKYLTGKVLEAKGKNGKESNVIKVQFDCDKSQDKNDAYYIPYANVISNYMYSMPDEGDRVSVYFEENGALMAIGSLRPTEEAKKKLDEASPEKKGFSYGEQLMELTEKSLSLTAGKKAKSAVLTEDENGITLTAKKNVLFKSSGDLKFQSNAGTSLKSGGAKAEKVTLSDFVKELDKKSGYKAQEAKKSEGGSGGSGGNFTVKAGKTLLLKVGDSSLEISKGAIKTRKLTTLGMIPGIGVGPGTPAKIGPGRVNNRSKVISAEHGAKDRSRSTEGGGVTGDRKRISRSG